jgi:hypothetical protein
MIQRVLSEPDWTQRMLPDDPRALTPLLYGRILTLALGLVLKPNCGLVLLLEASVGMTDREEGKLHTSPSLGCAFERATLVGRDMIGFVAFDFVLRIVFRSVMDMTFVIEVRGMDGDDRPCHTASFGIPAYMIAYLESPIHLSDSSLLPTSVESAKPEVYLPLGFSKTIVSNSV